MDLVHTDQMRIGHAHGICDAAPIDLHDLALIGTAAAAVQSRKHTRGCPTTAGEKTVAHASKTVGC